MDSIANHPNKRKTQPPAEWPTVVFYRSVREIYKPCAAF